MKSTKKDARELGDDDGGIDWRENDVADPEPQMRGGWVVLTSWCEVFEAKGLTARLEAAGLRCRVEISNDKPTDYVNEEPVFCRVVFKSGKFVVSKSGMDFSSFLPSD